MCVSTWNNCLVLREAKMGVGNVRACGVRACGVRACVGCRCRSLICQTNAVCPAEFLIKHLCSCRHPAELALSAENKYVLPCVRLELVFIIIK